MSKTQHTQPLFNELMCLEGCIRQNIASQAELYKHFYPVMMAVVLRYTTDADNAATILNNAFLKVFKHIKTFRHEGSLEGWIKKIVIHAVSDFFRYKHSPKEININHWPEEINTTQISLRHDYNLLLQALNNLPPVTRMVINLFIIDGYTHKEIGTMLKISDNTSKWHVAEGKKILQQSMQHLHDK